MYNMRSGKARKAFLKSVKQHDGSRRNKPFIAVNTLAELQGIPAQTGAEWLADAKKETDKWEWN